LAAVKAQRVKRQLANRIGPYPRRKFESLSFIGLGARWIEDVQLSPGGEILGK